MNILRKPISIELNGKAYDFILDFESAIVFQDLYKKSIFMGIDEITRTQDLKALSCLIASCLKDKNGSVGMDFVYGIDLMNGLPFFMEKLGELMENSLPEEDSDSDKKKVMTKN